MSSHALAPARRDSAATAQEVAHILTALGAPIPPPKTEHRHVEGGAGQHVEPPPPLRCPTASEEGGSDGNTSTSSEGSFHVLQHAPGLLPQPRHKLDHEDGDEAVASGERQRPLEPRADGGEDDGAAPADAKPPLASEDNDDGPAPALSFPEVLFEVVSATVNAKAISWLPHGKGFTIHDNGLFLDVLNTHFDGAKFTSFTRRLKRWNFDRASRGPEMGSYYNKYFQRDDPELIQRMQYGSNGKNGRTGTSASRCDGKGAGKGQQTAAAKRLNSSAPSAGSGGGASRPRKKRAATVSKKGPRTKYQEELRRQEHAEELSRYRVQLQMQMQTGQFPVATVALSDIAMYGRGRETRGGMQPSVTSKELGLPPSIMDMHRNCHNERGGSGREGRGQMFTVRGLRSGMMMPPPQQMQGHYDANLISPHDQHSHHLRQAPLDDVERRRLAEMGYPPSIHPQQGGQHPPSHCQPSSSRDPGPGDMPHQDYGPSSSSSSQYALFKMERELARLEAICMQDRLRGGGGGGFPPSRGGEHMLTMTSAGGGRPRTLPSRQGGRDGPYYSTSPAAGEGGGRSNKDNKIFSSRTHEEVMMMTARELGVRPVPLHSSSSSQMSRAEYGGGGAERPPASASGTPPIMGDGGRIGHCGGMAQSGLPGRMGLDGMPPFYPRGGFGGGYDYNPRLL
mmetsp:Transcript_37786/g.90382  ORF Transcript_37786/g.90382 Transcript_37786/m.90382 type:complete len:679 (+) Transcript_37786:205-2241(+)